MKSLTDITLFPRTALIGICALDIRLSIASLYDLLSLSCMVENQYLVLSLSITGSRTPNGRHIFIKPSTSPILTLIVTIAIVSLGEIICANCELVSILSSLGEILTTFCQGSLKRFTQIVKIRSRITSSISEKSLSLSKALPAPPRSLSTIANPRLDAISIIMLPLNGCIPTTPKRTGLERALENSEYITDSELTTSTCTAFRKYAGRLVDSNRP